MAHMISKVSISNFKSIEHLEMALNSYNVMVGCNNAGKSNVLNALSWLIKGPIKSKM